jgi:Flp pilus assembly protein TadG
MMLNQGPNSSARGLQRYLAGKNRHARRGALTIESLLALLLLTIGTVAVANFTIVSLKLQALQAAVVAGVRQAAQANLNVTQTQAALAVMQPICSAHGINNLDTYATLTFSAPAANELQLECTIGINDAGISNWLAPFGFSWVGHSFKVVAMSITN